MELTTVTLDNLGHGAARELFERELTAVLENILDPNTPPHGQAVHHAQGRDPA